MIDINEIKSKFNEPGGKLLFGPDGFVDEVWQVVESRADENNFTIYNKMIDFGNRIVDCGEGGISNEIVRKRRTFGGFTANTSNAALSLDIDATILGMYGEDFIDPVFERFTRACRVISVGNPAVTQIFEFADGKLMLPHTEVLTNFDWEKLLRAAGGETLGEVLNGADIIAWGYWSCMPFFDGFIENICSILKSGKLFFDFADIKKREMASLDKTMALLSELNKKIPMTLSLNEHECKTLFEHSGEKFAMDAGIIKESAARVREKTGLGEIVVHTPYFAVTATENETADIFQRFCENPVRTTAAGDTFNGGYLAAMVKKIKIRERLAIGNAATGFFIRTGRAANREELYRELNDYYG